MRFGEETKRDTQLIIISVLILTIVTLSVSYSAFFSVQSQSTIQEIDAGVLNVVIDSTSTAMSTNDLYPIADSSLPTAPDSVVSEEEGTFAKIILKNDGTLDADYSISIGYDIENIPEGRTEEDLMSLEYLSIGIFDIESNSWLEIVEGSGIYSTKLSALEASVDGGYPILRNVLTSSKDSENPTTKEYRIYLWLAENTPETEIGKLAYFKLDVKSATINGRIESQG